MAILRQALLVSAVGLLLCCSLSAEVTLSPTEVRVCRPARNKVVFTCSTTDGVLTWEVGSILYQFPDATSGNASKKLGQFLLAVVSNTSSVITSTATAENVTALGPTTSVVSCFGSVDESNITKRGYILARDPPSYPDLVDISVDSNNSVTVSWILSSNVCLDHLNINITTCSSDIDIIALRTDSSTTTISNPLPDNQSLLAGVCATVTPVDDRGRTPPVSNSTINKNCLCASTVLPTPTPTSTSNEGANLYAIVGGSIVAVLVPFAVMTTFIIVAVIFVTVRHQPKVKKKGDQLSAIPEAARTSTESIDSAGTYRARSASELQDAVKILNNSVPAGDEEFVENLDNMITKAQETKNKITTLKK